MIEKGKEKHMKKYIYTIYILQIKHSRKQLRILG